MKKPATSSTSTRAKADPETVNHPHESGGHEKAGTGAIPSTMRAIPDRTTPRDATARKVADASAGPPIHEGMGEEAFAHEGARQHGRHGRGARAATGISEENADTRTATTHRATRGTPPSLHATATLHARQHPTNSTKKVSIFSEVQTCFAGNTIIHKGHPEKGQHCIILKGSNILIPYHFDRQTLLWWSKAAIRHATRRSTARNRTTALSGCGGAAPTSTSRSRTDTTKRFGGASATRSLRLTKLNLSHTQATHSQTDDMHHITSTSITYSPSSQHKVPSMTQATHICTYT
mmetsp:Transcript_62187/g.128974  ORF Transcript_62187/g.128974 Transcript_62187/m.128974 type:complete len:292 (-) Transcript_62187:680-1555(-)